MSEKFINPLKEFKENINHLPDGFPNYLIEKLKSHDIFLNEVKIELGKRESWIDWSSYRNHYSFCFDFEDNENVIKEWLKNSRVKEHPFVIMEFGYQAPISEIPVDIFINYWYELVIIAGYESVVLTNDGKLYLEFIRKDYLLKSNFLIKP